MDSYEIVSQWGHKGASQVTLLVKNQEMQTGSLGWEDPLEEEMATHCRILAWRIPWTEEPGGLAVHKSPRVRQD